MLGCTIKFIDEDSVLFGIMACSKDTYEVLRVEVLKQSLLRASPERLEFKRPILWSCLLSVPSNYKDEFAEHLDLSKKVLSDQLVD